MQPIESQTKKCPFCAERIQAEAIKCRFCNEFLNTDNTKAVFGGAGSSSQNSKTQDQPEKIIFAARPSLFGLVGTVIKGLVFLAIAACIIKFPLEELSIFQPGPVEDGTVVDESTELTAQSEFDNFAPPVQSSFSLNEQQTVAVGRYRVIFGAGLAGLIVLVLLLKMVKLKMIYYEVTPERIEWSRGILDRRVDNLDMFRVEDLRLRKSLLDCIFGIGSVTLITTDKTDPEFVFEKIRRSRRLYDIIKKASLEADRKNTVIHME